MNRVAALFVATNGVYFGLPDVEPWDVTRDARKYDGPYPVVAHPPCQLWGPFAVVNFKRWGGEHNRPGNDGGCFESALASVRKYGGVLEHPAGSRAWRAFGLLPPVGFGWQAVQYGAPARIECVAEVWQSAYGHRANKRTWLFYSGELSPSPFRTERPIGTHQCGFHDQRGKERNKPTLPKREASATPLPFRDLLLDLARRAQPSVRKAVSAVKRLRAQKQEAETMSDCWGSLTAPAREMLLRAARHCDGYATIGRATSSARMLEKRGLVEYVGAGVVVVTDAGLVEAKAHESV